jgi:hypothetical protein
MTLPVGTSSRVAAWLVFHAAQIRARAAGLEVDDLLHRDEALAPRIPILAVGVVDGHANHVDRRW